MPPELQSRLQLLLLRLSPWPGFFFSRVLSRLRALRRSPLLLFRMLVWDLPGSRLLPLLPLPSSSWDFLFLTFRGYSRCLRSRYLDLLPARLQAGLSFLS